MNKIVETKIRNNLTVIRYRTHHTDDQPSASDCARSPTRTEIGVLPKHTSIFFMYTDDVFDFNGTPIRSWVRSTLCAARMLNYPRSEQVDQNELTR